MKDHATTVQELKDLFDKFCKERDWGQFHNAKNLSMNLMAEASELMEFFIWTKESGIQEIFESKREAIEHEVSDVAFSLFRLCSLYNIDLASAIKKKMKLTGKRYPVEKSKGQCKKYTEL